MDVWCIQLRNNVTFCATFRGHGLSLKRKKTAERILKIFNLGEELQPFVAHNARTIKINDLFVVSFLVIVSNR